MIEFHFPGEQGNGFQPSKPAMQVVESAFLQRLTSFSVQVGIMTVGVETIAGAAGGYAGEYSYEESFSRKLPSHAFYREQISF